MSNLKFKQSITRAFKELKILPLKDIYTLHVSVFMYKLCKGLLTLFFNNFHIINEDVAIRQTRHAKDYIMPIFIKPKTRNNIKRIGVEVWRTILRKSDFSAPIGAFKRWVKETLADQSVNT